MEESTEEKRDPGLAYVAATRESLATTPMEGGSIIDIHKGFQVKFCLVFTVIILNLFMYINVGCIEVLLEVY